MDFKIQAVQDTVNNGNSNIWDIEVDGNNDVVTVEGSKETDQMADIAASLETNSVPLVETRGVDWLGLLFKEKSLLEIDSEIRKNLSTYVDDLSFAPIYTKEGDQLKVQISRINLNAGVM